MFMYKTQRERERERDRKDTHTLNITKSLKSFKEGSAQHETTKYGYSGGGIEGVALNSQPPWHWGSWNINLRRYRNREKAQRRQIYCGFKCGAFMGLWCVEGRGMLVQFNQHLWIKQCKRTFAFCGFRLFGVVFTHSHHHTKPLMRHFVGSVIPSIQNAIDDAATATAASSVY